MIYCSGGKAKVLDQIRKALEMKDKAIDQIFEESLLFDFYGGLLTEKQSRVMSLYYDENYSIIEIAEEMGVSKQAVHENLRKSEKILSEYEDKLGLVGRFIKTDRTIREIEKTIDELQASEKDPESREKLAGLRELISGLNE